MPTRTPFLPASLNYLDQVARSGSIQRAARELHVAASAVDRQILAIEELLGVPMFDRVPRGMRLTPAGEVIVELTRRWRADVRRAQAQIHQLRGLQQGRVRLAAMDSHANSLLPAVIRNLAREQPKITLEIEIAGTDQAITWLLNGQVDVAMAFNIPRHRGLRLLGDHAVPFGCMVARDHPLARHSQVSMRECARYPIAYQSEMIAIRSLLEIRFGWLLGRPEPVVTNSIQMIKALVASGSFVAFLTPLDAAQEVIDGHLRFIRVTDKEAEPESLGIAVLTSNPVSKIMDVVVDALADEIGQLQRRLGLEISEPRSCR